MKRYRSTSHAKPITRARGYVLLEMIIALGMFATISVSLHKALHLTARTAHTIQHEIKITQVLQSAMVDALSNPNLEEGETTVPYTDITGDEDSYFRGDIETVVKAHEELENEDGQLLQNMFIIRVTFHWQDEYGNWQSQTAETWRYRNLYQP